MIMDVAGDNTAMTLYEVVGGSAFFVELIEHFYARVETDPLLVHMYPDDLAAPKANTAAFLVQYWGGPTTYSDERGHPRLRMRHAPFAIGRAERDAWVGHMLAAIEAMDPQPGVAAALTDYFETAATHMINTKTVA